MDEDFLDSGSKVVFQNEANNIVNQAAHQVIHGGQHIQYAGEDPQAVRAKAMKACRDALYLTDPEIDRATLIISKGKRVVGTCEWLRGNVTYEKWLQGKLPLLWICGGPGKGKTMLSLFLTEELEESQPLYYFCTSEDQKRNNAAAVLRSLLWQITARCPDLAQHLLQYLDTPEKTQASLRSIEILWSLFAKFCGDPRFNTLIFILDGLDECDKTSRDWLATSLVDLMSERDQARRRTALRIVIVSRDIPRLKGSATVRLDPDNNEEINTDVKKFISARVEELSTMIGFEAVFKRQVEALLLEKSEGTFLWVGFAMAELLKQRTCVEVEETLHALPRDLNAFYDRMLLQLEPACRSRVATLLKWATWAVRPLTLKELAVAVGCEATSLCTKEQVMHDLVKMSAPFLVTQELKGTISVEPVEMQVLQESLAWHTVNFVHQSAREYIRQGGAADSRLPTEFCARPEESELDLARTCLSIIQETGIIPVRRRHESLEEWALIDEIAQIDCCAGSFRAAKH